MKTAVLAVLLTGSLIAVVSTPGHAACPIGSFPWVDAWGNSICKNFETGQTPTIQGSPSRCPVGTHPWVDQWGNQICKAPGGNQQYFDTSKGCPVGTYPWVDNWGNKVCKFF